MPKRRRQALKGLGAKYGATVRKRHGGIIRTLKMKRRCSSCGAWKVKREAVGIWVCKSCGYTVAGGAYETAVRRK